jgi:hypothetical protein
MSHDDVATPNDNNTQQRSSTKGTGKHDQKLLLALFTYCLPLFRHMGQEGAQPHGRE